MCYICRTKQFITQQCTCSLPRLKVICKVWRWSSLQAINAKSHADEPIDGDCGNHVLRYSPMGLAKTAGPNMRSSCATNARRRLSSAMHLHSAPRCSYAPIPGTARGSPGVKRRSAAMGTSQRKLLFVPANYVCIQFIDENHVSTPEMQVPKAKLSEDGRSWVKVNFDLAAGHTIPAASAPTVATRETPFGLRYTSRTPSEA